MNPCSNCDTPVPTGSRFCPACGTSTSRGAQEERRIVTVLFADLVGYTTLAEYLDPEQVKRLIDGCFERLVDDVHVFGGRVDKILGDGILALFGAPVGHEDDPERAVRAGLRMHHTLAAYVADAKLTAYGEIRLRIGINTGEVLVGKLAGTDYTALGDVVNTTHRLQAAAPIGGVLVGESTHALTAHAIRYDEAARLQPKGREQPVDTWLAIEATLPPGASRRRRREGRLVGRDAELAIATAALDTVRQPHSVLVAISGDNGVGTTRLLEELLQHMRTSHDAVVFTGAAVPYGESNVWWPLAVAIFSYFDLEPGTQVEAVRSIILRRAELLGAVWSGEERTRFVDAMLHVLGYPSPVEKLEPAHARQAVHHAVGQALQLRAQRQPTVLAIDDFQWCDPAIVDLVNHLLHALNRTQFAVVTAMRPGHDLLWPPRSERVTVISLPLGPLSRVETEALATQLLGEDGVNARQLAELFERSGGNPLYLQELAALTEHTGEHAQLPTTLRTLIGARLDQLTLGQRQIIDNAATLGNAGPVRDLEYFAHEMEQPFDPADLRMLDELGLLEVQGRRWQFRSDSVREAAYQTLTKAVRAIRHAGVASALRKDVGKRGDDLAHHTATAAELSLELGGVELIDPSIRDEAVELLHDASRRALEAGSLRLAARHSTRALALLPGGAGSEGARASLLLIRASCYVDQRSFTSARTDLDAALTIAQSTNDLVAEGEARRLRGSLASVESDIETARIELGRSVELLRMAEQPERLADALRSRGWIELFGGSILDAEWFFGEAEELYRASGDERGLAWIEQHRAWSSFLSGDMDAAREQLTQARSAFEHIGDHNGEGWAGGLLAFVAFFQRNFEEAERLALDVGGDAERRGDEWAAAMMQVLLAQLRLWEDGRIGEAETLAAAAWRRLRQLGDDWGTMQALAPLVRAQVALGHGVAAQRSIEELLSLSTNETNGAFPLLAVAGAAMHRGDGASALEYSQRTMEELATRQMTIADTPVVRVVALAQLHRLDEALAAADEFPAEISEHPFAAAAAALVESLTGDAKEALRRAEQVAGAEGATYLDEVLAYVAAGNAHAQLDDPAQAALCVEAAVARAMGVGDVVATALATRAFEHITGQRHPAADEHTLLGRGWLTVIDHLTASHR